MFYLASRLLASPGTLSEPELALFTRVLWASLKGGKVLRQNSRSLNNVLILVCDKLNDMPPFLYINNPRARSIYVDRPDTSERERYFRSIFSEFHDVQKGDNPPQDLVSEFGVLTDGMTYYEILKLVDLSLKEKIKLQPIQSLIQRYKYGIKVSEWDKPQLRERLEDPMKYLGRIKGQPDAIEKVLDMIIRARFGLAAGSRGRPRGVLFFAGPTGVGKTEMAKALAHLLFGNKDRLLRFDMSEYNAEHADQRLLGAPPGYVGYEEGGQLTNAIKDYPFSVLLFDEIEKAHPLTGC